MRRSNQVAWIAEAVMNSKTLIFAGFVASILSVQALDWPQYRGPKATEHPPNAGCSGVALDGPEADLEDAAPGWL